MPWKMESRRLAKTFAGENQQLGSGDFAAEECPVERNPMPIIRYSLLYSESHIKVTPTTYLVVQQKLGLQLLL